MMNDESITHRVITKNNINLFNEKDVTRMMNYKLLK